MVVPVRLVETDPVVDTEASVVRVEEIEAVEVSLPIEVPVASDELVD